MLSLGEDRFHHSEGVLVNENGHEHDSSSIIVSILDKVKIIASFDFQKYLQKDFFANHLDMYSKSRRKAPIYWLLQTPSGSYSLWLYYHRLNEQTLFTCVNDFVEPKLESINEDLTTYAINLPVARMKKKNLTV